MCKVISLYALFLALLGVLQQCIEHDLSFGMDKNIIFKGTWYYIYNICNRILIWGHVAIWAGWDIFLANAIGGPALDPYIYIYIHTTLYYRYVSQGNENKWNIYNDYRKYFRIIVKILFMLSNAPRECMPRPVQSQSEGKKNRSKNHTQNCGVKIDFCCFVIQEKNTRTPTKNAVFNSDPKIKTNPFI